MISRKNILLALLFSSAVQVPAYGISDVSALGICIGTLCGIARYIYKHPDWEQQLNKRNNRSVKVGILVHAMSGAAAGIGCGMLTQQLWHLGSTEYRRRQMFR